MDKQNVVYPYGIIQALNTKEILTHVTTWVIFENIMLNEKPDKWGQILYNSSHMRYLE